MAMEDLIANGTKSAGGGGGGKPMANTTSGVEVATTAVTSVVVGTPGALIGGAAEVGIQAVKAGIKAPSAIASAKQNLNPLSMPSVPGKEAASKIVEAIPTETFKTVGQSVAKSGVGFASSAPGVGVRFSKFQTKMYAKALGKGLGLLKFLGKLLKLIR